MLKDGFLYAETETEIKAVEYAKSILPRAKVALFDRLELAKAYMAGYEAKEKEEQIKNENMPVLL